MKTTIFSFLLLSILCFSCQSEYERQLAQGKKLIEKEVALSNSATTNYDYSASMQLDRIKNDLHRCGHLSGNESLFKAELNDYKSALKVNTLRTDRLITKYP